MHGHEDGNDANSLRIDPVFKMAHDLAPSERDLCSQSTISRLENLPDARALLRMGRAMVDLYCESFKQVPRRITLDIDDTFDAVHGGQQLRLFNAHYDEYGFQPIVVFDGDGRFITAVLRPAKRPGVAVAWWGFGALAAAFPDLSMGSYPFNTNGVYGTNLVIRGTDPGRLDQAMTRLCALFG